MFEKVPLQPPTSRLTRNEGSREKAWEKAAVLFDPADQNQKNEGKCKEKRGKVKKLSEIPCKVTVTRVEHLADANLKYCNFFLSKMQK